MPIGGSELIALWPKFTSIDFGLVKAPWHYKHLSLAATLAPAQETFQTKLSRMHTSVDLAFCI